MAEGLIPDSDLTAEEIGGTIVDFLIAVTLLHAEKIRSVHDWRTSELSSVTVSFSAASSSVVMSFR